MTRYCGNCGTEVDDTAVFCPTCGQPIDEGVASEIPAAPAWPDAAPDDGRASDAASPAPPVEPEPTALPPEWPEPEPESEPEPKAEAEHWREYGRRDLGAAPPTEADDAPTRVEQRPSPTGDAAEPGPERAAAPAPRRHDDRGVRPQPSKTGSPKVELPFTMPVTLSGWLIGGGTLLAALGVVIILITTALNAIDLLLLVALLGVAATVFLSARMPAISNLRLISLVVALIAFGVALDRVGFRGGGAGELLLFMGAAAAAIGAVILELGQDQPLGGPQR